MVWESLFFHHALSNDLPQRTKQILVFPLEEAAHKRSFYIVYTAKQDSETPCKSSLYSLC